MYKCPAQDKEEEKKFFSKFSSFGYDVISSAGYENLFRHLFREGALHRGQLKILDLGCGSGAFTQYLMRLNGRVFAVDICHDLLKKASFDTEKTARITADIEKLPLVDRSFDIVIFSGVLHHLPDLSAAIREAGRVLKEGGLCFSYDPNGSNPLVWLFRDRKSPFRSCRGRTINERQLRADELKREFNAAYFTLFQAHAVSGVYFKASMVHSSLPLLLLYNFQEFIFSKIPFSKRFGSFLICTARR